MALSYTTIRAAVRDNIGGRTDLDSNINTYINQIVRRIGRRHRWRDLEKETEFTTTDSVKRYSLATDLEQIHSLRLTELSGSTYSASRKLVLVSPHIMDQVIPIPEQDSTGKPKWGVWWGKELDLYPIPDSVIYTVRYRYDAVPTDMSADNSTASITNIDDVIIAGATMQMWAFLEESENAGMWSGLFESGLKEAIRLDRNNPARKMKMGKFNVDPAGVRDEEDPFQRTRFHRGRYYL